MAGTRAQSGDRYGSGTLHSRYRVHTTKKNSDTFVVARVETGLEVNADKSKHMVTLRDQNAGRSHNIKIDNVSL